jgi:two-component system chemotaxis response regulator CheY
MTLLVVDDADWSANMLEIVLVTLPNAEVVRTRSGVDAWRLLQERPVSAIITDLHMPNMDGFELIERVRAMTPPAIPIIVVSADGAAATRARARQLGANAFFVKPYSPAEVRDKLEELLHDPQTREPT